MFLQCRKQAAMWQLVYSPRRRRSGRHPLRPTEGAPQSSVQPPWERTQLPQCLHERVKDQSVISLHLQARIQPAVVLGAVSPQADILGPRAGPGPLSLARQEIFAARPAARPCHFDSSRCLCAAAPSEVSMPGPARMPVPVRYPALRSVGLRGRQLCHMAGPSGAPRWQWSGGSSSRPVGQGLCLHEAVRCLYVNACS